MPRRIDALPHARLGVILAICPLLRAAADEVLVRRPDPHFVRAEPGEIEKFIIEGRQPQIPVEYADPLVQALEALPDQFQVRGVLGAASHPPRFPCRSVH